MTAYVIFTRESTKDRDEIRTYRQVSMETLRDYSVTPVVAYGRMRTLEGSAAEGMAILAFPTFEEAERWYDSPAYQEAMKHRIAGAEFRAVIVEGFDPPAT